MIIYLRYGGLEPPYVEHKMGQTEIGRLVHTSDMNVHNILRHFKRRNYNVEETLEDYR